MSCKVITIAQQKGGAGKTTVAAHLAVTLAKRGKRIAIIDIDPQGSLTTWHNIRKERFGEEYTGFTFSTISGWRVGGEIARLKRDHDIVIIDSPPHTETEARTAIRNADLVIVPVQPSPTDLWATKATLDLAVAERVPIKVVLNRVPFNSRLTGIVGGALKGLAETTLGNRVLFAASLMEGLGVLEADPHSTAALEIKALAKEILAMFPREEENTDSAKKRHSVPA